MAMGDGELDPTNPHHRAMVQRRNELTREGFEPYIKQWNRGVLTPREFVTQLSWKMLEVEQLAEREMRAEMARAADAYRWN